MTFSRLFQRVQRLLDAPSSNAPAGAQTVRIATAGLLLDVAHADEEFSDDERERLLSHVRSRFELDDEAARELIEAADEARNQTIDHFAFANLIRSAMPIEGRLEILRTMWRIVFADGVLTQHEEYLVRKLADLLGIERHIMIEQKLLVKHELGLG